MPAILLSNTHKCAFHHLSLQHYDSLTPSAITRYLVQISFGLSSLGEKAFSFSIASHENGPAIFML